MESLAASYPTVCVYVIDTVKCKSTSTFMSNMLVTFIYYHQSMHALFFIN